MATKRKTAKKAKAKKKAAPVVKPAPEFVLVLRTCAADGSSHSGFKWPALGPVECTDWNPEPVCGGGLHGLAWGEGDWSLLRDEPSALWQIVKVASKDIVAIDGLKVKFPRGEVVFTGCQAEAMTRVLCSPDKPRPEAPASAPQEAASSGDSSKAASSGDSSKAASSGDSSKAASSGDYSTAASSGYSSTAAAEGENTIAMAAGVGTVKAGKNGCIATAYYDGKRYRAVAGNIGETKDANGDVLMPDVFYRLNERGMWVKA